MLNPFIQLSNVNGSTALKFEITSRHTGARKNRKKKLTDMELVNLISQKIGRPCLRTSEIIRGKIGYVIEDNHIIQLSMNECNLMNETIPEELWELKYLKTLCISTNMISRFPEDILQLQNLVRLDLNGNQIRVITGKLKGLKHLERLNLAGNQLETVPLDIGLLPSLRSLRLNSNRLCVLPNIDPNCNWSQLETLELDGADIKELPQWLFSLKALKALSLSKLHLNHFPEEICHLQTLERLYLDSTKLLIWPDKIILPSNMRYIVLDGAYLTSIAGTGICRIPDAIVELKPKYVRNQQSIDKTNPLFQVSLGGNISNQLDDKQLFNDDPNISYEYLKNLYKINKDQTNNLEYIRFKDIKVILLGSGAVGKSSLVQRLCLQDPDDDNIPLETMQTTHGVNVDYQVVIDDIWDEINQKYDRFTAHFWDFGGQDKYRGINKLLMTDKAIYIIVLDSRSQSIPDIWLEMIKIYAPNSKIILVVNKVDENPRLNINFKYYCDKYSQLYNCLFKISCKYPSLGINKITDIMFAIKKIIERQINIFAPVGKFEWVKIQLKIESLYRVEKKVVMSTREYIKICNSSGVSDKAEQEKLLYLLSAGGSCIAVGDEQWAVLNPNWLADYLYFFYNINENCKPIMDYKKEYRPLLRKMEEYSEYGDLITEYLEYRGLCIVFFDRNNVKKIFIPMFLSEETPEIEGMPQNEPLLEYIWRTDVIPEYEFHKFLVREFLKISKESWYVWQFGLYFQYGECRVYLQLLNTGFFLKIWSHDIINCGECFQWLRSSLQSITVEDFFDEFILVENENGRALLPYGTLKVLNSWNVFFYCLPEQSNSEILIPVDIQNVSQKCGLKGKTLEEETSDENILIKKLLQNGGVVMNLEIKKMLGDVNNYETHGNHASIMVYEKDKNLDITIKEEIADLKDKLDKVGDGYDELKIILNEIEKNGLVDKNSIKNRIGDWLSQSANLITIGTAMSANKQVILESVHHLLNLI